jgi:integrase
LLQLRPRCRIRYRWHDLRHTFISRLAENPNVSEQTIRALAGHVSRQVLERFGHIRSQAKQAAIRGLEEQGSPSFLGERGHKNGHTSDMNQVQQCVKPLKANGGPSRI